MTRFLLLLLISCNCLHAKTLVTLYTYYDKPPFIVSIQDKVGLSFDFAKKLSKFSQLNTYQVKYFPKKRALSRLADSGAILWVNPHWIDDKNQIKYLWTKELVFERELYVSNDQNLRFTDESSLYGKTLIGVRGYNYFNLDPHVSQQQIKRLDVDNETLIPKMLIMGRGDFGVIGLQTFAYLIRDNQLYQHNLYILTGYTKYFGRSIAISANELDIKRDISRFIQSNTWKMLSKKWLVEVD
ncbi:hypothetical protein [Catenovulum agarivorans]|uniref:hypothetical protein n=1 Tax=Catenovulum agarivorans TaxID=1172192 RepID=UPI0002E40439|nr:hypothetical protein [Catenovulum agarivorans]